MDPKKIAIRLAQGLAKDMFKELTKGGSWLPVSKEATADFMDGLRSQIKKKKRLLKAEIPLHPVMQEFQDLIDNDSIIRMNFTKMIDQVPGYYREKGTDGKYLHGFYLESIEEMIHLINHILTTAPEYNDTDLVGFPINTILNWTMGVPAGAAAFRNQKVNDMFRKVLAVWTDYLDSRNSLYVFRTYPDINKSWRSLAALKKLNMKQYLEGRQLKQFLKTKDPVKDPFPYKSWNDFFIRPFKNKVERPINKKKNGIVSACDSGVYNTQFNAKLQDWFWLKSQPYSLWDLLANEDGEGPEKVKSDEKHFKDYVKPFKGGTVYQAFLSAFKYHRWHSPVSGTIKKAYVKDGTYYSATQSEGMAPYAFYNLIFVGLILIYKKITPNDSEQKVMIEIFKKLASDIITEINERKYPDKHPMVCSQFVYQSYEDAGRSYRLKIKNGTLIGGTSFLNERNELSLLDQVILQIRTDHTSDFIRFLASPEVSEIGSVTSKSEAELAKELIGAMAGPSPSATAEETASYEVNHELLAAIYQFAEALYAMRTGAEMNLLGLSPANEKSITPDAFNFLKVEQAYFVTPADLLDKCVNVTRVGVVKD